MSELKTIESPSDLELLIETFYGKVLKDPLLLPFFQHFDLQGHIPRMIQFWSFALLDEPGYSGSVIEKHLRMHLKKEHFDRWVDLFEKSLDELFTGEKVTLAKQKVAVIRWTMEAKINVQRSK